MIKRLAMFLFMFGLPGGFAEWCDAVTTELARGAFGAVEVIRADTLEQIALEVIATGAVRAVVSSRQPGRWLRGTLVENAQPFIVALDDPGLAVADLVLDHGVDLAAATQAVGSSCAALTGCGATPGALILQRNRDWPQPAATAAAIAAHFSIEIDAAAIAAVLAAVPPGEATRRYDEVAWWNSLTPAAREMTSGAIVPFIEHQAGGELRQITWAHELFFRGDQPNERAAGPVDITGRARLLLHGPYIMLPTGSWSLTLTMSFARTAAEHEFLVQICTDRVLASGTIRPQQEGNAELAIDFDLADTSEHPIDIRVSSLRAAFDGSIAVVGAAFRPVGAASDPPAVAMISAGA